MKRALARVLRAAARRLDPPAPTTTYSGQGMTLNIYGVPQDNAAAIGDAIDWVSRTQLGDA